MDYKYLKHLAARGASFIHPHGKAATSLLIEELDPQKGDKILEMGCGTGATIAVIAAGYDIIIDGCDAMDEMLSAARKRIAQMDLTGKVTLNKVTTGSKLLYDNNNYDKIYNESVLGFLEEKNIKFILKEIYRVLKPGGIYIANESLWKENTADEIVKSIYRAEVNDFGLAQASGSNINVRTFLTLCNEAGFETVKQIKLEQKILKKSSLPDLNVNEKFNRKMKLKSIFSPALVLRELKYRRLIAKHKNDGEYIESWIIKLKKPL